MSETKYTAVKQPCRYEGRSWPRGSRSFVSVLLDGMGEVDEPASRRKEHGEYPLPLPGNRLYADITKKRHVNISAEQPFVPTR